MRTVFTGKDALPDALQLMHPSNASPAANKFCEKPAKTKAKTHVKCLNHISSSE
jgi:hypothetical protein